MRSKRVNRIVHDWFTGVLRGNTLVPARGCTHKVVELGETIEEKSLREPQRYLTANIGDRLMLFGESLDQIQIVTVTSIRVDGWKSELVVSRGVGAVNDGNVHVHKIKAAA